MTSERSKLRGLLSLIFITKKKLLLALENPLNETQTTGKSKWTATEHPDIPVYLFANDLSSIMFLGFARYMYISKINNLLK